MHIEEDKSAVLEALSIGLQTEKDGYRFYLEASEKVLNSRAKAVFQKLANDEIIHLSVLTSQYNSIEENEIWIPHEKEEVKGAIIFPDEEEVKKRIEQSKQKPRGFTIFFKQLDVSPEKEIFELAMKSEKDGEEFYKHMFERTINKNGKVMFNWLAEEERRHYDLLETELESLHSEPGR